MQIQIYSPVVKKTPTPLLVSSRRGRSVGEEFSRISLFEAENHCSLSHKFLQISPNEQARSGFCLTAARGVFPTKSSRLNHEDNS